MSTTPQQIGPYVIESEIGRGGMGVVYKAMDTRLDRAVAIKALPEIFAADPDRLARFEREAKTLATLNHPNVAGIYGIEEAEGARYLVMEYVDGETLADRLDRGALAVDETIELCAQVAAGLEAAHDAGVIHRDLKPANIKITPDGHAKVLDFGLARTDEASSTTSSSSQIATLTSPHSHNSPTVPGAVLGTAPYMSPEQARGRRVDKRTDIWAFGVLLYECLTGSSPFVGETATDSIGAILHKDVDLDLLPPGTPRSVRHVIERCLQRDKSLRMRDIGDARIEILSNDAADMAQVRTQKQGGSKLAWLIACVMALAAIAFAVMIWMKPQPEITPLAFDVAAPGGHHILKTRGFAFSPDGTQVAFTAINDEHESSIHVRSLVTGETQHIEAAGDAQSPFWSPDGEFLAFIRKGLELWKIDLGGGSPEMIAILPNFFTGGEWLTDNTIVMATNRGPIVRVRASGGEVVTVIDPFPESGSDLVVEPDVLPDLTHVLFMNEDDEQERAGLYIGSLETGECKRLMPSEINAVFTPPDIVVLARSGSLYAQRIDLEELELIGEPVRVASDVWQAEYPNRTPFEISADGKSLMFFSGASSFDEGRLVWIDRETGEETPTDITGELWAPRLSHDGRRLAIDRTRDLTTGDISVIDLERGTELLLTQDLDNESSPIWSHDDSTIYYYKGDDLYAVSADRKGAATLILDTPHGSRTLDVTSDGRYLYYIETAPGDPQHRFLDLQTGESTTWLNGGGPSVRARLSPDDRWIAYDDEIGGEQRVFLSPIDNSSRRVAVSRGAAGAPAWRADGKELFYRTREGVMAVPVDLTNESEPIIGEAKLAFSISRTTRGYALTPDGKRFLFIRLQQADHAPALRIIRDWKAALQ